MLCFYRTQYGFKKEKKRLVQMFLKIPFRIHITAQKKKKSLVSICLKIPFRIHIRFIMINFENHSSLWGILQGSISKQ